MSSFSDDLQRALGGMTLAEPFASTETSLGARLSDAIGSAHVGDNGHAQKLDAKLTAMPIESCRAGRVLHLRARHSIARGHRPRTAAQAKAFPLLVAAHGALEVQASRGDPPYEALLGPGA